MQIQEPTAAEVVQSVLDAYPPGRFAETMPLVERFAEVVAAHAVLVNRLNRMPVGGLGWDELMAEHERVNGEMMELASMLGLLEHGKMPPRPT